MTRTKLAQTLCGGFNNVYADGKNHKTYNAIALILNELSDEQFKKAEKIAAKVLGA